MSALTFAINQLIYISALEEENHEARSRVDH